MAMNFAAWALPARQTIGSIGDPELIEEVEKGTGAFPLPAAFVPCNCLTRHEILAQLK
jgi:hypothetical protein